MINDIKAYVIALFDSIFNFFTAITQFLNDSIYDFVIWIFKGWIEYSTLNSLKFALLALNFAWDIARGILSDLQFSSLLSQSLGALPPEAAGLVAMCRVPEALSLIATAAVTKYCLRFIPFVNL